MNKNNEQINEREILYQGLNWHIGVDGCYINNTEKEPILNHLYELALACRDKSEQLKHKEQECENNKIEHQMELDIYKQECLTFFKASEEVNKKNKQLKQTLAEIKEIAGELLQTKIPFCAIHEKIIKKINEVIDE